MNAKPCGHNKPEHEERAPGDDENLAESAHRTVDRPDLSGLRDDRSSVEAGADCKWENLTTPAAAEAEVKGSSIKLPGCPHWVINH